MVSGEISSFHRASQLDVASVWCHTGKPTGPARRRKISPLSGVAYWVVEQLPEDSPGSRIIRSWLSTTTRNCLTLPFSSSSSSSSWMLLPELTLSPLASDQPECSKPPDNSCSQPWARPANLRQSTSRMSSPSSAQRKRSALYLALTSGIRFPFIGWASHQSGCQMAQMEYAVLASSTEYLQRVSRVVSPADIFLSTPLLT